jgi:hypothetical protein
MISQVALEAFQVETDVARDLDLRRALAMVLAVDVLGDQEAEMEALERVLTLVAGGDRRVERGAAAALVVGRLFPELPLGTFDRVDLLERKIPPPDVQTVAEYVLDLSQPDRRGVDIRSAVIKVDVESDLFPVTAHRQPLWHAVRAITRHW